MFMGVGRAACRPVYGRSGPPGSSGPPGDPRASDAGRVHEGVGGIDDDDEPALGRIEAGGLVGIQAGERERPRPVSRVGRPDRRDAAADPDAFEHARGVGRSRHETRTDRHLDAVGRAAGHDERYGVLGPGGLDAPLGDPIRDVIDGGLRTGDGHDHADRQEHHERDEAQAGDDDEGRRSGRSRGAWRDRTAASRPCPTTVQ
jgi:hypothetical protein